jgi:zinc resistance-associated protein
MKKLLGILTIALLIGAVAVPVMALGPGWGRGGHMMYDWGNGPGNSPYYGRGYESLTPEQQEQLNTVHKKFYDETNQIRNELWTKRAELNEAINTASPDAEKARAIQKEISDLRAQLDQKRIDLALEEHKINPDAAGYGRGYGPGYGRHMWGKGFGPGSGMRGGFGPGYCWN